MQKNPKALFFATSTEKLFTFAFSKGPKTTAGNLFRIIRPELLLPFNPQKR